MKKDKSTGKILGMVLAFILVGATLTSGAFGSGAQTKASPATIYVPTTGYPTIQSAVDAASPGDTIIVRAETYTENVNVSQGYLTIVSQDGPAVTTVHAASADDHVFYIGNVNGVKISGFTIRGATTEAKAGICLENGSSNDIVGNILSQNWAGVRLVNSDGNEIHNNDFSDNTYGIEITEDEVPICAVAKAVMEAGISAEPEETLDSLRTLRGEQLNPGYVDAYYQYSSEITSVLIAEPALLIEAARLITKYTPAVSYVLGDGGEDSEITKEGVEEMASFLASLSDAVADRQESSTAASNSALVDLLNEFQGQVRASEGKTFSEAFQDSVYFAGNKEVTGLASVASAGNIIYLNNFRRNTNNVRIENSTATWNSVEKIPYIYSGNVFEDFLGNYWSDYMGSDLDGDGIGNTPHSLGGGNTDNYPLWELFENYEMTNGFPEWVQVASQAVAYICNDSVDFRFARDLAPGSKGDDVKFLQILLNSNPVTRLATEGVGSPGYEIEDFGPLTQAAVKKFQEERGLAQTGLVAGETLEALNVLLQQYAPVKTVPAGWALKVINAHKNTRVDYSCIWWEVEDVTDGTRGWTPYKNTISNAVYLAEIASSLGEQRTQTISSVDERKSIIVDAVRDRAALFPELASFPSELMLAIVAGEMPDDADNTYVSFDCGRGISQITTNSFVGDYSGVRCYCGSTKGYMPYEFVYPFDRSVTKAYWTDRGCINGTYAGETSYRNCGCKGEQECEGTQAWYYGGTDTSGRCTYCGACDDGCRVYTNTVQGIVANLKDGKGVLRDYYVASLQKNENTESDFTFTTQLAMGHWGKEVAYLQYMLKFEIDQNLPVTAYFGSMTQEALKDFQARELPDREPSGVLDQDSRNIVNTLLYSTYSDLRSKVEDIKSWVGATWRYNHGNPVGTIKSDRRNYLSGIAAHLRSLDSPESRFPNCRARLGNDVLDEADRQLLLSVMDNYLYFEIRSPVDLRICDSEGNITGMISGQPYEGIPDSLYDTENEVAMILLPSGAYIYEVIGTTMGSYGAEAGVVQDGEIVVFSATDIPVNAGTVHRYVIDWDVLAQGEKGVIILIDSDGDGVFEDSFTSDEELTSDEFILHTETVVDFDPDTLNLKSRGEFVTVYIELPSGYDVTQIDITSIRLNSAVPAVTKPAAVGDYDKDGVPDLMVKFRGAAVCGLLTPGNQVEITIAGQVGGIGFEDTDAIRVIRP